jgi:hypothetical protein
MLTDFDLPDNIDDLVNQFVTLRDKVKASDDAHKEKTRNARDYLEALGAKLLERLNEVGGTSVKTEHGTVYRSTKRSASIADGELFRSFVQAHELFDLVDWRANANAVDDYIKENEVPPPGVNFSTQFTIGVRRA